MIAKDRQNINGSPKVEVGEIDTRAPFQSVKDAVNLFGEAALSGEKPAIRKSRPHSAERVLAKETQLHLAQKELNKLKDHLKKAEAVKSQALTDLEKAKLTVVDLTEKLQSVEKSKESVIKSTEAAINGNFVNDLINKDMENRREEYVNVVAELDAAKKLLRQVREDRDKLVEAKAAAFKLVGEAEDAAKANTEKAVEISKEINVVQESIGQVKVLTTQAQQEQTNIFSEKNLHKQSYKAILEDSAKKLLILKKEYNPDIAKNLESQLVETINEVDTLKKEIEKAKATDTDSVKTVSLELVGAKGSLQKVAQEKISLQSLVESLKVELENVKRMKDELIEREAETEALAGNLHNKLQKSKNELEKAVEKESKTNGASEEMNSTLQKMITERENAKSEAEEAKNKAEGLKKEAEGTNLALLEAEKKLELAIMEAEEVKSDEKKAVDRIKEYSEKTEAARVSVSGAKITISREEFEALRRREKESDMLAEMRVAAAMAQVDAVRASENEAVKKLEMAVKEIEDKKAATKEALKRAEMAEAAKKAVEAELRRWREREQKKAADAASLILEERETSSDWPPRQLQVQKQVSLIDKVVVVKKFERRRTFLSKKVLLPKLGGGFFLKKTNKVEGGYSQSYLPGEEPI